MTIQKTKNGHNYIEVTLFDITHKLHGLGICDSCCGLARDAKLIPVLNSVYCSDCFENWAKRAKNYPEDRDYENSKTLYFMEMLNNG